MYWFMNLILIGQEQRDMPLMLVFKDGDPIVVLLSMGDKLLIYKQKSIWSMQGDNLEKLVPGKRTKKYRVCKSLTSVIDVWNWDIYFKEQIIFISLTASKLHLLEIKIKPFLDLIPDGLKNIFLCYFLITVFYKNSNSVIYRHRYKYCRIIY